VFSVNSSFLTRSAWNLILQDSIFIFVLFVYLSICLFFCAFYISSYLYPICVLFSKLYFFYFNYAFLGFCFRCLRLGRCFKLSWLTNIDVFNPFLAPNKFPDAVAVSPPAPLPNLSGLSSIFGSVTAAFYQQVGWLFFLWSIYNWNTMCCKMILNIDKRSVE